MLLRTKILLAVTAASILAIGLTAYVTASSAEDTALREVDRALFAAAQSPEARQWRPGDAAPFDPNGGARQGDPAAGAPGAGPVPGSTPATGPAGNPLPGPPGGGTVPSPDATADSLPTGPQVVSGTDVPVWIGLDADGEMVVTTDLPVGLEGPLPDIEPLRTDDGFVTDQPRTVATEDGGSPHFRALAVSAQEGSFLVVAYQVEDLLADVDGVWRRTAITGGLAVVALVVVLWFALRAAFRPLDQLGTAAGALAAGELDSRVSVRRHDEVGELATSFNEMADTIERAFGQRDEAEGQLRQFLADASHELRTPLTSIVGFTDLYQAGALDSTEAEERAMERIGAEGVRMMKLVEDLLLLARLDQGRPLKHEPVDLVPIVEDVVTDARAADPDRPIEAATPAEAVVEGDGDRLRQVVTNLVTNARTHTPPGSPVTVSIERDNGRVRVVVRDQGEGIEPEVAARIFDRFWSGDPARTRNNGGVGLGLSIVRSIVDAHGGDITVESELGEGSRFAVVLEPIG